MYQRAGVPFFIGCVAWNCSPAMVGTLGLALLKFLVMSGALLQVRCLYVESLPLSKSAIRRTVFCESP